MKECREIWADVKAEMKAAPAQVETAQAEETAAEATQEETDLGNNESVKTGVFPQENGEYLALTFTKSKTFKTEGGAIRWYKKQTGETIEVKNEKPKRNEYKATFENGETINRKTFKVYGFAWRFHVTGMLSRGFACDTWDQTGFSETREGAEKAARAFLPSVSRYERNKRKAKADRAYAEKHCTIEIVPVNDTKAAAQGEPKAQEPAKVETSAADIETVNCSFIGKSFNPVDPYSDKADPFTVETVIKSSATGVIFESGNKAKVDYNGGLVGIRINWVK